MENNPPRRAVLAAAAVVAASAAATGPAHAAAPTSPQEGPADLVLTNGRVYTVDKHDSVHRAVAITRGRIVYVGTAKGAAAHIGEGTTVVDLKGRMVMPGLHDGHIHPMSGGEGLIGCDLAYAPLTVEQFQAKIRDYLDKTKDKEPDAWVIVSHWYVQAMRPKGTKLTKAHLDALDTERPIVVYSTDGHTTLVNSRALKLAGITAKTKNPPSGTIERDKDGEPTGVLQDGADAPVSAKIPRPTAEENVEIARTALAALAKQGVTTFMDAIASEDGVRAFDTLRERGELTARAHFAPLVSVSDADPLKHPVRLRRRYDGGRIGVRPGVSVHNVKLILDGVLQYPAQTAGLLEPYLEHKHDRWVSGAKSGAQYWKQEQLDRAVLKLAKAGFEPHIHAIGDRSVRVALNAYEHLRKAGDHRTRATIAHAELVDPRDLPRFGRLDVVAAMGFHWAKPAPDSVDTVKPYLGDKRWSTYEPEGDLYAAAAASRWAATGRSTRWTSGPPSRPSSPAPPPPAPSTPRRAR